MILNAPIFIEVKFAGQEPAAIPVNEAELLTLTVTDNPEGGVVQVQVPDEVKDNIEMESKIINLKLTKALNITGTYVKTINTETEVADEETGEITKSTKTKTIKEDLVILLPELAGTYAKYLRKPEAPQVPEDATEDEEIEIDEIEE